MTAQKAPPFKRNAFVAKPGIVGARWWQESVAAPVGRRGAMVIALVAGAGIVGVASVMMLALSGSSSSTSSDVQTVPKGALEMQREYGWSFGVADESIKLEGASDKPVDLATLASLYTQLAPAQPRHTPYYSPTLFQSPTALPRAVPAEDAQPVMPLIQAIRPVVTPSMREAFQQGRSLASLFETVGKDTAVVVDLPGPDAVAFAAGAAKSFEPIFGFDNWPHPRGVVPAHQTLAAALEMAPALKAGAAGRDKSAPGMFVLDRNRLAPYADEATQFDNRYVAKLPDAAALKKLGYKNVLYVVAKDGEVETDDLNEDFVAYRQAELGVRILPTSTITQDPAAKPRAVPEEARDYDTGATYAYGGSEATHYGFWVHYPFARSPRPNVRAPNIANSGRNYVPAPRRTAYSSGTTGTTGTTSARPRPTNFGLTPVVIGVATGAILGSRLSRSGSWNRSGGSAFG